jgi:hypothetical protein
MPSRSFHGAGQACHIAAPVRVVQVRTIIGTYTAFFLFGGQYPHPELEERAVLAAKPAPRSLS